MPDNRKMNNRAAAVANRFTNKFGSKPEISPRKPANDAAIEHLRVSTVKETDDQNATKYVEIAMAGDQSDDDGQESEADFYQPIGLSPYKSRNDTGSKVPGSDTKFFHQLQSHRQEQR